MTKRSAPSKFWLGLGTCLVRFTGLIWLSHRRAAKTLQTWKARMAAQGERLKNNGLVLVKRAGTNLVGITTK